MPDTYNLAQKLRTYRETQGLSMLDLAEKMRCKIPHRKLNTLVSGCITFFEKNWAELGYALNGREPWKTYLQVYIDALGVSEDQRKSIDQTIQKIMEERVR